MCEINQEIKLMSTEDNTQKMIVLLSDQIVKQNTQTATSIREMKNEIISLMDREIGHINKNLKQSQLYINEKLESFDKSINKVTSDSKDMNNDLDKRIENLSHNDKCPNNIDDEIDELKKKFKDLEIQLGPIISIAKYKVLQFMLVLTSLVLILLCISYFTSLPSESKELLNKTEKLINK